MSDDEATPCLDHWQEARERDIQELRTQVRNLQLAIARIEAATKPDKPARKVRP